MAISGNIADARHSGRAASHSLTVAAGFGDTDLTAQTNKPNHAPQLVDVKNSGGSAENIVYTDYKGVSHTRPLSSGESYPIEVPVASLSSASGDNVMATAYWWPAAGSTLNS